MMAEHSKLLIIGLDGLNWAIVDRLNEVGSMPTLARLKNEGAWGTLTSVVPTQSATAWASFLTGQNPARHGVLDFMVRHADGTYHHSKPHPSTTLWHYLGIAGLRVGVLNFPVTYPPDPVNGFLISGMLTPKGRAFTHPLKLGEELLTAVPGYRLDLEWQLYRGRDQALLRDLTDMTRQKVDALRYLRARFEVDCLAVAFVGPDRLQHGLLRYLDPDHPDYYEAEGTALKDPILEFYAVLDDSLRQVLAGVDESTTLLILSDHGFQSVRWQFRVDDWLAQHGWLARQTQRSRLERFVRRFDTPRVQAIRRRLVKDISRHFGTFAPGGTLDWSRTVAFSPWFRQQGIRLNVQGREPHGIVVLGTQYEQLRTQIRQALLETTEPQSGQRVVDRVWFREELFDGQFFEELPDLVFELRPGFTASPVQQRLWEPTGWASGDHSLEGLFLAWGRGVEAGRIGGASLLDIAPTAIHLLGQPIPAEMDGKVLVDALGAPFLATNPIRMAEPGAYTRPGNGGVAPVLPAASEVPDSQALTQEEESDLQERLRGLGYL